jgi:4-hydroxymandelate oxidase
MPVLVAPTAFHRLACPAGELATARAAGAAGTVMTLSSLSNTPLEEVTAAATGPVWFQLYVYKDRNATEAVVTRAEAAGCKALVLTVDAPYLGRRERDVRNRFALPAGLEVSNMVPAGYGALARPSGDSGLAAYVAALLDPSLSWKDLATTRAAPSTTARTRSSSRTTVGDSSTPRPRPSTRLGRSSTRWGPGPRS